MRVGLLTSRNPGVDDAVAGRTLPLMKHYCAIRGYSLYVGMNISEEGMYELCAPQCETAMQFVPITFTIRDMAVRLHGAPRDSMLSALGVENGA